VRTISRKPRERDPQRLYAERLLAQQVMRQSDPNGDMRRTAEMTVPPCSSNELMEVTDMPKVAKFLVG
jgi:hypothetical protein